MNRRELRRGCLRALTIFVLLGQTAAADPTRRPSTYEERAGLVSSALSALPIVAPVTRELAPPSFPDATAVWGSTGRDLHGRIWYGLSATSPGMSAHLMQYDPVADTGRIAGLWSNGCGRWSAGAGRRGRSRSTHASSPPRTAGSTSPPPTRRARWRTGAHRRAGADTSGASTPTPASGSTS